MSERLPPSQRSDYPHFCQVHTRWMDNDMYGHVNNVVYYSYFDTAVNEYLISRGVLDPSRSGQIGLVVESGCRYHSSLAFPDLVQIGLRVGRIGSSSLRYELAIFRNDELRASAEGHFVHVYVDRETNRPAPINHEMRRALARLELNRKD